jgi:hypothetical protein
MTYATSRLSCVLQHPAQSTWVLDTVDTIATVNTAGFISDGGKVADGGKGMEKGDLVYVNIWTTAIPAATSEKNTADDVANDLTAKYICTVIGISTAGAVDLTDGLAITITNTD